MPVKHQAEFKLASGTKRGLHYHSLQFCVVFFFFNNSIYFWLCWFFVAVQALPLLQPAGPTL